MGSDKDGPRVNKEEVPRVGRNAEGKKPNSSRSEGPSLMELSGYNCKRQEFDPEYDNDAEQLVAEMEFNDTETKEERELKLRVLHIYLKRLDERKRRMDFILERNLQHPSPFEMDLTPEERALCRPFDRFMRFHSKEEHEELLQAVVEEHRTLKRIEELNEANAAGCRTTAEADRYLEQKRKKKAEESSKRLKHNAQIGPSNQGNHIAFIPSESVGKDSSARPAGQGSCSYASDLDITGFYETQLLSETEKRLCSEIHLPPPDYLKMQMVMTNEIFSGKISKRSDAHPLFSIEASKVDRVYDMLVKKGIFSGTREHTEIRNDMSSSCDNSHSNDEDPTQRFVFLKLSDFLVCGTIFDLFGLLLLFELLVCVFHNVSEMEDGNAFEISRQKKNAASKEVSESSSAGQGSSSHGKKALYHCNFCNKDITGKIRVKCAECLDFDLCVECFSEGEEVPPHKSNHPYMVMVYGLDSGRNAASRGVGLEMFGFGNWEEVAVHVNTKSKETCIEHYNSVYMQSPCFPLPDMSTVFGKNRKELLATAEEHSNTDQNFENHDGDPANIGASVADNSADVE
ncbi:unnamed protein product [Dovyalis caffra]|uniref:Transcriptional adapter n=1 Tax=Dovyalis caffra TaxID=77055 RepID=A0AAV1QTU3_9ROSI|nr:unnamed protein product [Dovyalis caffra]